MSDVYSKIFCEHPVVILNPAFDYLLSKCTHIRMYNGRLILITSLTSKLLFLPKRNNVNKDNYDACCLYNDSDGTTYPLYFLVPCNRCTLCSHRKKQEICARAVCETNSSTSLPLFITLTYNDKYLPSCGLVKRDLQLFFKRLRKRLDDNNIEHNLRYLAVGEYGSKHGRAHYHIILWNFPSSEFANHLEISSFISRCWSVLLTTQDENGKFHYIRIPRNNNEKPRSPKDLGAGGVEFYQYESGRYLYKAEPLGFVKVLPVTQGCIGYVSKYMYKRNKSVVGKNPLFCLSSRRNGGIGASYIRSHFKDDFLQNPDIVSFPVLDEKVSQKVVNLPLTPYVRNLFFPSPSSSISVKLYQRIKSFYSKLSYLKDITYRVKTDLHLDNPATSVVPLLDYQNYDVINLVLAKTEPLKIVCWPTTSYFPSDCDHNYIMQLYTDSLKDLIDFSKSLLCDIDNFDIFVVRDEFLKHRSYLLSKKFANMSARNVSAIALNIQSQINRNQLNETF